MLDLTGRSCVRVVFPADAQYGYALYRLRKTLKEMMALEVHKQPDGAQVVCTKEQLASVLPLLASLEGFSVVEIQE